MVIELDVIKTARLKVNQDLGIWSNVMESGRRIISVLPPVTELFKLILPPEGTVQIHICLVDIYI